MHGLQGAQVFRVRRNSAVFPYAPSLHPHLSFLLHYARVDPRQTIRHTSLFFAKIFSLLQSS